MKKQMTFAFVAVLLAIGGAQAMLVDDFESYAAGPVGTVTEIWENVGPADNGVIAEEDAENQVLSLQETAGTPTPGVYGVLSGSTAIENGQTKTLFFKFRASASAASVLNYAIGLTDVDAPNTWGNFRPQIGFNTSYGMYVREGSTSFSLGTINVDDWYNLWMMVDHANKQIKLYMNQGVADATETDRLSSGGIDVFGYRVDTDSTLDCFFAFCGNNATEQPTMWVDSINVFDGESFVNPGNPCYNQAPEVTMDEGAFMTTEQDTPTTIGI
ncbi:MAG: hypothetical protein JW709_01625, partial [Sedimentisphaerales bacterium]|nr:hypothetical protein [Sedimentisphaerales bacterium]